MATNSPQDGGPWARADAVAGLAREVDRLRRQVDAVPGEIASLAEHVDRLKKTVDELSATIKATPPPRPAPLAAESWLAAPVGDPAGLVGVLAELCAWLETVFLRYPDAHLPACWLWHPAVVEELWWCSRAWSLAYQSESASVTLAGDWHDRQRPGVVRRITAAVSSCSPERHQPRPASSTRGGEADPSAAPTVPGVDLVAIIAAWWGNARTNPAPPPREQGSDSGTRGRR